MHRLLQRLWLAGAILLLAGCSGAARWEEPAGAQGSSGAAHGPASGVPAPPQSHTVQAGETLYAIAFRYGLSPASLAAWNQLGDGTLIRPGQRLRLWAPSGRPAQPGTVESSARVGAAALLWQRPVPGPVLARFGDSPLTAAGIQLSGRTGDPVRAAAGGLVVYAGSGLVGYGELLIIKHNSEWLSAYGYNQALLVREGEVVEAGQPIARMGEGPSPGMTARRSLLHFEIRRNGAPVDPLGLLPASAP